MSNQIKIGDKVRFVVGRRFGEASALTDRGRLLLTTRTRG
jgi:hypothetical protein